jgi:hypothetical protein
MTRLNMTTREWHELIKPVISHASGDKELPELDVVRLELGESALYAAATDRYTLAAERWPLPPEDCGNGTGLTVHLSAREVSASLRLFTHNKDEDPLLTVIIDTAAVPISVVGQSRSLNRLAVTVQQVGDGTRLMLHDERDPSRDPLGGWRKMVRAAMIRPAGRALDGLDLSAGLLARWTSAARKGERLTLYTGPEPGDPLLVTVEKHFAGVWAIPQYLDAPGKTLSDLPWHEELNPDGADSEAGPVDMETGERLEREPDDQGALL